VGTIIWLVLLGVPLVWELLAVASQFWSGPRLTTLSEVVWRWLASNPKVRPWFAVALGAFFGWLWVHFIFRV